MSRTLDLDLFCMGISPTTGKSLKGGKKMAKKKIVEEEKTQTFYFMVPNVYDPTILEMHALNTESKGVKVESLEELCAAGESLVRIKRFEKLVAEKKEKYLKPVKDQLVKPMEKVFREALAELTEAEVRIKGAISKYKREQDELLVALGELSVDSKELMTAEEEIGTTTEVEGGKITMTPKTVFEVENASLVPEDIVRAAVLTNRGKEALREVIRARIDGGIRKIPGVKIDTDFQVAVTVE